MPEESPKTFFDFFVFDTCKNCGQQWKRKHIKESEKGIKVEYSFVHVRNEFNEQKREMTTIYRCLRCFKEKSEIEKVITENDLKQNIVKPEQVDIEIKTVTKVDEKELNDEKLDDLIF